MSDRPCIGITMGDPAGIGPEIVVKALSDDHIYSLCRPVVLGDQAVLSKIISEISKGLILNVIQEPARAEAVWGKLDLLPISHLKGERIHPGNPSLQGGKAMGEYIVKAVDLALKSLIDAVVTCPINKKSMDKAGYPYEGHTQLLAHLTQTRDYVMMLSGERLRVALVTTHCALQAVPAILNEEGIYKTITITGKALKKDFGMRQPRLAVAALNPHAGEAGLFGTEEETAIAPAVRKAEREGHNVTGPFPADTLFHKAASGEFDAVIAMYHDQGLIPLKLLHFSDAVNVTLGLPIIRTSVDHGTAYDIAGMGKADASSLKAAIKMAATIVKNRSKKADAD